MTMILVTGSTGVVGTKVVEALREHSDVTVRAATRLPETMAGSDELVAVAFDWHDRSSIRRALDGVDAVFSLTPVIQDAVAVAQVLNEEARRSGVGHLVRLSTMGTELDPGFAFGRWHREIDDAVEASGVPFTILRPGTFMDNFLTYFRAGSDGALYLPWRDGAASFIDTRDIAAAAAVVLTTDGHEAANYLLTGPAALTGADVAAALSRAGQPIRYVDVSPAAARSAMVGAGLPPWLIEGLLELHEVIANSDVAAVTDEVQRLTGHPPRTFDDFARDHAKGLTASASGG